MVRNLVYSIKIPPWGATAQKDAKKLTDEFRAQDKATKELIKATKKQAKGIGESTSAFEKFGRAGMDAARGIGSALSSTARGIDSVTKGLEGAVKKVFSLKNVILGSVLGAGAYKLGESIFSEGRKQLRGESRARREFGFLPGNQLISRSKILGLGAGVQSDEALTALIPIQEIIQAGIAKGGTFNGKRLRTESDVAFAKGRATEFSSKLLQRLMTLHPDLDAETIGQGLAAAGSGPEGFRMFAGQLGFRNPALLKKVRERVAKKGLGTGDAINELLNTFGDSEAAAASKRKTFDFQIKSIKAQLTDALGDVGVSAMAALNKKFGEGETLASKLEKTIASPEGQKAIQAMADGLSKMVGFAADLALKIPAAFSWIEEHKTLLTTVVAGYAGLKVVGGASSLLGGIPGLGGLASKAIGDIGATPVRVVNWEQMGGGAGGPISNAKGVAGGLAGVAAAGGVGAGFLLAAGAAMGAAAGGAIGIYLDNHVPMFAKANNAIANKLYDLTGQSDDDKKLENMAASEQKGKLARVAAKKRHDMEALQLAGLNYGQALYLAEHRGGTLQGSDVKGQPINITLTLDGKVVSQVVANHVKRDAKNATAAGAAR